MSIKDSLRADLTEAIRGRNQITSSTIRMVLTAITNEEVAGKEARVLSDDEVIVVLSREAKKRREAAEAFEGAGHPQKAALEKSEGEVIAKYLPAQLTADEVKQIIAAAIASTGAAVCETPFLTIAHTPLLWNFVERAKRGTPDASGAFACGFLYVLLTIVLLFGTIM